MPEVILRTETIGRFVSPESTFVEEMSQKSLEIDIVEWIAERTSDDALRAQCREVEFSSRKFSGVGSFTHLRTPSTVPSSSLERSDVDPVIKHRDLPFGGGCVLFLKDGRIDLLEIYVNGDDPYPDDIEDYQLSDR